MEGITEVDVTVTRIVLNGEDPRRFMDLLRYIRAGLPVGPDHKNWAVAMLEEIKREAF